MLEFSVLKKGGVPMGFLKQRRDGTTNLNILVGGDGVIPGTKKRPVLLGQLTGKLTEGTGQLTGFREDRWNLPQYYIFIVRSINKVISIYIEMTFWPCVFFFFSYVYILFIGETMWKLWNPYIMEPLDLTPPVTIRHSQIWRKRKANLSFKLTGLTLRSNTQKV